MADGTSEKRSKALLGGYGERWELEGDTGPENLRVP